MAASLHHEIRRGGEGFGSGQTWEGLNDLMEDLKKLPLEHPDIYRNRTLNRNPRYVTFIVSSLVIIFTETSLTV